MSDNQQDGVDDMCSTSMSVAVEKGLEMCNDPEATARAIRPFFGLDSFGEIDREQVLAEGIDATSSMTDVQTWVYSRTVQLLQSGESDLYDAMDEAWEEANEQTSLTGGDDDILDDDDGLLEDDDEFEMDDMDIEDSPLE